MHNRLHFEEELDLTPLIDVAFLLQIFFALDKVAAHVQEGVAEGKRLVVIKADRDVASGFVEDVAREASRAEGIERFLVGVVDAP